MILVILDFAEHVKQEDAHIFVQVFVIEEELGQKRQILTVDRIFVAVNFKHSHIVFLIPVYLISRRMEKRAYL